MGEVHYKEEDFTLKSKTFVGDAGNIHVHRWINTNGFSGIQLTVSKRLRDGSISKEKVSFADEIQAAEAGEMLLKISQANLHL